MTVKRCLLVVLGTISLILGIIGVFLPVLPTTPFLLLASFCYIRSSKRMYDWLLNHRIFGSYIYNYLTYKAVKKSIKMRALVFLWVSLGISFFLVQHPHVRILLPLVGIGVTIHLCVLKTLK